MYRPVATQCQTQRVDPRWFICWRCAVNFPRFGDMTKYLLLILASTPLLVGCTTEWGYKMRTGTEVYAATVPERVDILYGSCTRPYKQIGMVSVSGGGFSSDVNMLAKLRKAAADIGADAVIVTSDTRQAMTIPAGWFTTTTFTYPMNRGIAIRYTN